MTEPDADPKLDEAFDLRRLLSRLLLRRWWIVGSLVLFTAGFAAVAFLTPPVYRATAVLVPATANRGADSLSFGSGSLGGLASGLGIGSRDIEAEEALAVLRSRELTERFIIERKLMPKLFPDKWDPERGAWRVDENHRPTLAKAYKYFDTKIRSITQDRKTGLITLQIDWTDRSEAAEWANELVHRLNEEMRARAIAGADASLQYLDDELQKTSTVEIRDAINRLIESQVKQRMLAHVVQDYSLRIVDKPIGSDQDEPIKPKKLLLLLLGPAMGLGTGIALAMGLSSLSPGKNGVRN